MPTAVSGQACEVDDSAFSKGSEFDVVFLAGVEEKLLPHHYALVGGEVDIAEERRLCYVA